MTYILAFMMRLSSPSGECRWMRLGMAEARDEGFRVQAVCAPIETQSRATSLPNFPR